MTKKAVSAALVWILLYNLFLYDTGFGIGTSLLFLLFNSYIYITRASDYNKKTALVCMIIGSIAAVAFSIRANEVVQLVNFTIALWMSGIAYYFLKLDQQSQYSLTEFVYAPLNTMKAFLTGVKGLFIVSRKSRVETGDNTKVLAIIRGLGITIPVVGILLLVLYNADPIFAKLAREFTDSFFNRLIISVILFTILFLLYKAQIIQHVVKKGIVSPRFYEPAILSASVILVLTVFLFIQIRYVFMYVSPADLQKIGIISVTYSEYVRKGFFELLIAAAIASSAIIYGIRSVHNLDAKNKKIIQTLTSIVTAETAVLLIAAGKRVMEYNLAHGLTRARIFGIIFLIWMSVALIIMLINIIKKYENYARFQTLIGLLCIGVIAINVVNVDGVVANVFRPTVNKEVDYNYISELSTDAYTSWEEVITSADRTIENISKKPVNEITPDDNRKLSYAVWSLRNIHDKSENIKDKYGSDTEFQTKYGTVDTTSLSREYYNRLRQQRKWQSYNLSEWNSFQWIQANKSRLDKVKELINQVENGVQNQIPQEIKDKTNYDRSPDAPLI